MKKVKSCYLNDTFSGLLTILDEQDFRHLVVWLEDIKIKHYKELSQGDGLRRTRGDNWNQHYQSYLKSTGCPPALAQDDGQSLCWLLGEALMADDEKCGLDIKGETSLAIYILSCLMQLF